MSKTVRGDDGEDNAAYGPPLPASLINVQSTEETYGPDLPPHLTLSEIGPKLPPHLQHLAKTESIEPESSLTDNEASEAFGPALPPHLSTEKTDQSYGPMLPPHLKHLEAPGDDAKEELFGVELPAHLRETHRQIVDVSASERYVGPALPPGFNPPDDSSSSEEESFGPDPRLMVSGKIGNHDDVDYRAEMAKKRMLEKPSKKPERETWMLDLPPERAANLGLGPRQFRAKPAPEMGDRSVWTDTPADKAKKQGRPPKESDKDVIRKQLIAERDKEMDKMAEKGVKRKESLLASHTKKLKQEAKDGTTPVEPNERKRFNREEDMQVNRFDEAQKKAIFKKAQHLNDRFSQGESKYL